MKKIKRIASFTVILAALGFMFAVRGAGDSRAVVFSSDPTEPLIEWEQNPTATQNSHIAELEKKIAGQENKPAEEVFKNIQLFKGMPAGRVLRVMAIAFAPALGVDCSHCHTPGEWEKDDKEAKQTARKMWVMMPKVNNLLKETIGKGTVNCMTCHRGQVKPALNLSK
ncbi:MAG: photosynthetic reaction center cytochrome c subunit family protein [Acidobacteriota bacterium]